MHIQPMLRAQRFVKAQTITIANPCFAQCFVKDGSVQRYRTFALCFASYHRPTSIFLPRICSIISRFCVTLVSFWSSEL